VGVLVGVLVGGEVIVKARVDVCVGVKVAVFVGVPVCVGLRVKELVGVGVLVLNDLRAERQPFTLKSIRTEIKTNRVRAGLNITAFLVLALILKLGG
jgi:hypothetical protein